MALPSRVNSVQAAVLMQSYSKSIAKNRTMVQAMMTVFHSVFESSELIHFLDFQGHLGLYKYCTGPRIISGTAVAKKQQLYHNLGQLALSVSVCNSVQKYSCAVP